MAFAAQTVTTTLNSFGNLRVRKNSNATTTSNGAKRTLERVVGIESITIGKRTFDHIGYNADGTAQLAYIFEQMHEPVEIVVNLDEMREADLTSGAANWRGYLTDVDLSQVYPKNTTKGWRLLLPLAYCEFRNITPNMDTPTQMQWVARSYRAPGSAVYQFDDDYTL